MKNLVVFFVLLAAALLMAACTTNEVTPVPMSLDQAMTARPDLKWSATQTQESPQVVIKGDCQVDGGSVLTPDVFGVDTTLVTKWYRYDPTTLKVKAGSGDIKVSSCGEWKDYKVFDISN